MSLIFVELELQIKPFLDLIFSTFWLQHLLSFAQIQFTVQSKSKVYTNWPLFATVYPDGYRSATQTKSPKSPKSVAALGHNRRKHLICVANQQAGLQFSKHPVCFYLSSTRVAIPDTYYRMKDTTVKSSLWHYTRSEYVVKQCRPTSKVMMSCKLISTCDFVYSIAHVASAACKS